MSIDKRTYIIYNVRIEQCNTPDTVSVLFQEVSVREVLKSAENEKTIHLILKNQNF